MVAAAGTCRLSAGPSRGEPAVHDDRLAGHESARRRGEEQGGAGDVVAGAVLGPGLQIVEALAGLVDVGATNGQGREDHAGQIAFTRIRSGASSIAVERVRLMTAAFAAE